MLFNLSIGNFYGIYSLFEILIIIVAVIISYSSYRVYKLIKEDKYKLFSLSFLSIAISFIFKILSNLTILYQVKVEKANFVYMLVSQWRYAEIFNFICFILYKFFHIIGIVLLFLIITKTKKNEKKIVFLYLSIVAVVLSIYYNFIFHVTLVILLFYITVHFYENYKDKRTMNSLLVLLSFSIMLITHVFFAFSGLHYIYYLLGEILLLISFINLLLNQMKMNNKTLKKATIKK